MRKVEDMSTSEREDCYDEMLIMIQSAVESEQVEPAEFKYETELRINFACINLREMLGLPPNKT